MKKNNFFKKLPFQAKIFIISVLILFLTFFLLNKLDKKFLKSLEDSKNKIKKELESIEKKENEIIINNNKIESIGNEISATENKIKEIKNKKTEESTLDNFFDKQIEKIK